MFLQHLSHSSLSLNINNGLVKTSTLFFWGRKQKIKRKQDEYRETKLGANDNKEKQRFERQ